MPEKGWALRNYRYLSESLLPAILRKREKRIRTDAPEYRPLDRGEIEVTWIGHASFLIRTPAFNALIDPVWAKWVGPIKRSREPGLEMRDLPPIDLVMITHAHFDHLCRKTLRKLTNGTQTVLVPEGVSQVLNGLDIHHIEEMSEWESYTFRNAMVHFTPAHHWGARFIHDTHRGFGGFVIETPGHSLYHSGDSAYFDGFAEIGRKHDIHTALLPIGAYDCPSGREVHMNPEEAIRAFLDLEAGQMIPMHHATFAISNEHLGEPISRLTDAVRAHQLDDCVLAPHEGEQVILRPR